jgi:hypothetical protein
VYALAECDETITHLEFLIETGSVGDGSESSGLIIGYDLLSKKINKYITWVDDSFEAKAVKKTGNWKQATGKDDPNFDEDRQYRL